LNSIVSKDLPQAISLLENEELVAIPTETVYGLAGNIYSEKAITSIFQTKKRPFFNPLIVHISNPKDLKTVAVDIPDKAQQLADSFWPGSLTLVLKKKANIPELITAGKDTVAVRVPDHPLTLKLLKALDFPLAAPSANPFGSISPTTAAHVAKYFSNSIKMVLDGGPCKKGIESTIIGFEDGDPIIYRMGSISIEAIEQCIGPVKKHIHSASLPEAPGMLERHYAPNTKSIISTDLWRDIKSHGNLKIGLLLFRDHKTKYPVEKIAFLSKDGNFEEAAKNLYAALHHLDASHLDVIIIEKLPNHGLGEAINDRINRATK
jgi:L-threonylcarbamoyladenylate synthase